MSLVTTHRSTAARLVPDHLQREDDGSISLANATDLSFSNRTIIQANGFIGDGPFGSSSGDFDVFRLDGYEDYTIDVDATVLGSSLDAVIEIYDLNGNLIASNDNDPYGGLDPFLSYHAAIEGESYVLVIRGAGSTLTDPTDSGSGTGVGSIGAYRVIICNTFGGPIEAKIIHGTDAAENLTGTSGNDVIVGNGGNDPVSGGDGDDLFVWNAGDGADGVDGGPGSDVQEVNASDSAETFVLAPIFSATSIFLIGDDALLLDVEGLDLRALGGNDSFTIDDLSGNFLQGPIRFWGGAGNDTVNGSAAINQLVLNGGLGKDILTGGLDADTFDFDFKSDSRKGVRDVIKNFDRTEDVIDLVDIDAKSGAGNQAFKWIGVQDFHGRKGELHYLKQGNHVIVEGDTNGDGRADFQIQVNGVGKLSAGDFNL
jgi:Ca2+-binding RTX toxin-like protein